MPRFNDSVEKVKSYIKTLEGDVLILSNMFFRDYTCPSHCGGCCPRFSLDYVKNSKRWSDFKELYPEKVDMFKERIVDNQVFMSDLQDDHTNHHCRNLNMENGRCMIHGSNPFSCEFELMKIQTMGIYKYVKGFENHAVVIKKLFGRGWALTKIDGTKGAICKMIDFNYEKFLRDIELLKELREIIKGFGKENKKLTILIDHLEDNKEYYRDNRRSFSDGSSALVITEGLGVESMKQYKERVGSSLIGKASV